MSRRGHLRGGLPRLFKDHRSELGRVYRAEYNRLLRLAGPGASEEVLLLAADVAELFLRKVVASQSWAIVAEARLRGKGRRPTEARLRTGAKRAALDGQSYREALANFSALLAGNGHRPTLAELAPKKADL